MLFKNKRVLRRIVFLVFLAVSQCVFFTAEVFKINKIKVEGCSLTDKEYIKSVCQFKEGGNYLWDRLKYQESCIPKDTFDSIDISLKSKGVLCVSIHEKKPVVSVWTEGTKEGWFLADAEGSILCPEPERGAKKFLRLKFEYPLYKTGRFDKKFIALTAELDSKISKQLPDCRTLFYSIDSCENINVYTELSGHKTELLFGNIKEFDYKLKTADNILKVFKQKGKKLNSVDVRFQTPAAVVFNPKAPAGSAANPLSFMPKVKTKTSEAHTAADKAAKPEVSKNSTISLPKEYKAPAVPEIKLPEIKPVPDKKTEIKAEPLNSGREVRPAEADNKELQKSAAPVPDIQKIITIDAKPKDESFSNRENIRKEPEVSGAAKNSGDEESMPIPEDLMPSD